MFGLRVDVVKRKRIASLERRRSEGRVSGHLEERAVKSRVLWW